MQDCWEYDPQDRPGFDLISYRLETLSKTKLVSNFKTLEMIVYNLVSVLFLELHRFEAL